MAKDDPPFDDNAFDINKQFGNYLYRMKLDPTVISSIQYDETRKAFFGGFGSSLHLFKNVIGNGDMSQDQAINKMESLVKQFEFFILELSSKNN